MIQLPYRNMANFSKLPNLLTDEKAKAWKSRPVTTKAAPGKVKREMSQAARDALIIIGSQAVWADGHYWNDEKLTGYSVIPQTVIQELRNFREIQQRDYLITPRERRQPITAVESEKPAVAASTYDWRKRAAECDALPIGKLRSRWERYSVQPGGAK